MKKYLISALGAFFSLGITFAQSSMTDEQVVQFVLEEQHAGASQQQIVTKLLQKGVDINQLQRVRNNYERMQEKGGLGTAGLPLSQDAQADSRLRQSNADNGTIQSSDGRQNLKQQKFEQGQKIVFGRDVFNNELLTFEPNMNIATPDDYILGAGDVLFIDIYGATQKTLKATISPDGFAVIENFGPIQVSGLTVAQANIRIRSQLGERYSSSEIRLSLGQTRTIVVNVMGEVKAPGTYTLSAFASVFHALYVAGGPNDIGTLRNIKVYRHNSLVSTVDVYDYIMNGKLSGNVRLDDNDVIVVGPYESMVNISGKVKRPMYYEMKSTESVGTLIDYAGGFTGDAYRKSVRIVRKSGSQYSVHNVNESDLSSFRIADNDSVSVDSMLPRFSNMVAIRGAVFRPGMYEIGNDINSVKSLIEHAEGVTEEAFTAHAVIHRLKDDRTLEALSVDVDGIMNGAVPDIPLKNEDVLFIPTRQDAQVEQTISIQGEVLYPGQYQYAENETLEDFVLLAGGLKESASMHNVLISRRVSNPHALTADSVLAQTFSFSLKDGFVIDGQQSFCLMPFDEVFVRKSPGYYKQQDVTIEGEVMFAGTYTLSKKNERLSDLFKLAGGGTDLAYIEGAKLVRKVNAAERARIIEALNIRRDEKERLMSEMAIENSRTLNEMSEAVNIDEVARVPETYSVGIELDKALKNPGSDIDVVLREGDRIIIPTYDGTVRISGEVMHPNSVAYQEGKSVKFYIGQAGGYNRYSKKKRAYIIYMNGTMAKVSDGAKIRPGCEIVVPQKAINRKMETSEYLSIASTSASIATMGATIGNLLK